MSMLPATTNRALHDSLEDASQSQAFDCLNREGSASYKHRAVADEVPVAIELNGFGYAVLMATPCDIEDLLFGFLQSERVIAARGEITAYDVHPLETGIIVRATVTSKAAAGLTARIRHRATDSSCGLCGVENLEQVFSPLPRVPENSRARDAAIFKALDDLPDRQPLNRVTGGVHAAALCDSTGTIRLVREDIGRHNAFDKLCGAMVRDGLAWERGFALLSSRCSYELVEKAALAGCPMLVTISAPTRLALQRAREAGLALRVLARRDAMLSPA